MSFSLASLWGYPAGDFRDRHLPEFLSSHFSLLTSSAPTLVSRRPSLSLRRSSPSSAPTPVSRRPSLSLRRRRPQRRRRLPLPLPFPSSSSFRISAATYPHPLPPPTASSFLPLPFRSSSSFHISSLDLPCFQCLADSRCIHRLLQLRLAASDSPPTAGVFIWFILRSSEDQEGEARLEEEEVANEEATAIKVAGSAWYQTMISDSDYTEFKNFSKWLGVI